MRDDTTDLAHEEPEPSGLRERIAERTLAGPLALAIGLLCLWELATWAPNYMTWPLWADHDVFATAATSWEAGVRPYRDVYGNNFPGTTYLFWLFGKLFGFGWALGPSMYGFDAGVVALLGIAMVIWSARRFGGILPGLVGYGGFLGYYLSLDYSQAAQRDFQGPAFALLGLLIVQAGGGRTSRTLAALLSAVGLIIRPQVILLLPAQALAVASEARRRERSAVLAVVEWAAVLASAVACLFLPLIVAGLWGDFRNGLKVVAYGGKYNLVTPTMFLRQFLLQLQPLRVDIVPLAIYLLAPGASERTRNTMAPWTVAFLSVLLYRPMSPNPHTYLTHPLMLVWAGLVALLVQTILDRRWLAAPVRLVAVLLVAGLGLTAKPQFCNPNGSLEAFRWLKTHKEPGPKPTGYLHNRDVPASGYYDWKDYCDLLDYLRTQTSRTTKVANCLKFVPAINGPTARLAPFPAESIAWVVVVRADDTALFAKKVAEAEDCVVVWSPSERTSPTAPHAVTIFDAIEAHYAPSAKFGALEVWTRRPKAAPTQ